MISNEQKSYHIVEYKRSGPEQILACSITNYKTKTNYDIFKNESDLGQHRQNVAMSTVFEASACYIG